jgi:pimeloyl-ACP methyl ester carboxylesterase
VTPAKIREQAYLLGPRKSLVGIITESGTPVEGRPTVVILNAGIIHRVGPSRLNVLMARALAAAGCQVLRFDLSGLGDSEPRPDGLAPIDAAKADIREALDWLESARNVKRVVLAGLCSGANHALGYGGTDRRVVGLVLLDPATPKTWSYYVRHYAPRLFRPSVWYSVLRGSHPMVRDLAKRVAGRGDHDMHARFDLQSPEVRALLEQGYRGAVGQGVRFLTVLTGGQEHQHNYARQIEDAFPQVSFGDRIRSEYFEGTEHTFTAEADRARLFRLVAEWIDHTWPREGQPARAAAE